MKVAVVGSREFSNLRLVYEFVQSLPPDTTVVSGGARGVDRAAEQWARQRGLKTEIYPAQWEKLGKKAGYVRNVTIVEAADSVVAFWDGRSPGTRHTIETAKKMGKPVRIIPAEALGSACA